MARPTSYGLQAILKRLGVKDLGQDRLDLIEAIQPVLLVGDATHLAQPLLAPSALLGGAQQSGLVGATFASFEIAARGAGGAFVTDIVMGCESTSAATLRISSATMFAAGVSLIPQEMGPVPIESTGRRGQAASIQSPNQPTFVLHDDQTGGDSNIPDVFVPSGMFLQLQTFNVNLATSFLCCIVRDVPEFVLTS